MAHVDTSRPNRPPVAFNATPPLEPAAGILRRLGGPGVVARKIGRHRTRVSAWQRPAVQGGTGGVIPQEHFGALLELAQERGVQLAPRELIKVKRPPGAGRRP